ncbi:Protein kinase domain-containing protein ppk32 [Pleurostoma richardsiae]|uniref:Protein kinase domain-containing protein ppk32 n=1 Tax=Pleurostoma richardsiae TaxID=41990 RepID=A0AA38RZT1_9PEZI|nr:Protein kinase domain-containing protein ppk32 [Pleurostoma richardsiae]
MFSSALKSISSTNITSNYSISPNAISTAGPWKIHDAKKKSTGKTYSVFVFDKKSLDAHGSSLGRSGASAFKKVTEEVVERLKKEASALARLRHPSILELVEPVEETRGGGLQFVTEAVTASLASLLQEKDDQEQHGGVGGRSSRYVTEDSDGTRRRRELEIDELEIQKGLLQVSKALEFLHDNAGLVHGNLTPEGILINAKSDWKVSGLAFCSPPENSSKPTSFQPISLYEVLNPDPRLPHSVQLNLDYTSPDFVLDNNLNSSADLFSLGLLCVALYNSPHRSPIECHSSISSYKRVFTSSSTIPSHNNNFLSSRPLPRDLSAHVLPRLITRRPAQRMTAKEFQESEYFDNILVSTIRFLDSFPAKTANEKSQFMRGLNKVLPSFPKSVMEKKVLPALLEETKDKDLLSLILANVFKIIDLLPSAKRAFGDKVRPVLKETFVINAKQAEEKDPARDAGLMVVLENLSSIANNCSGKDFKDDILPVVLAAIQAPTHSVVDVALRGLPVILPVLDFSTIKNELFPIIATVFSRTNSLAIKVRGLQAFVILCGGSTDPGADDGLDGLQEKKKTSSSSALDKYTMQEKIVPLIKAIKTKEPAVMIAALNVLRVVGQVADADFVAMEILPVLWHMSLGPLLDLKQFQAFMELIKSLSRRVEDEQTKKLQELSGTNGGVATPSEDFMAFGGVTGTQFDASNGATEDDFERLVKGRSTTSPGHPSNPMDTSWGDMPSSTAASPGMKPPRSSQAASFSWSTPSPTATAPAATSQFNAVKAQQPGFRTVTPDLSHFNALTPSSTQFSQPLQPASPSSAAVTTPSAFSPASSMQPPASTSVNWSSTTANPWASSSNSTTTSGFMSHNPISPPSSSTPSYGGGLSGGLSSLSLNQQRPGMSSSRGSSFSLPPPPGASGGMAATSSSGFGMKPPPSQQTQSSGFSWAGSTGSSGVGTGMGMGMGLQNSATNSIGMSMSMGTGMGLGGAGAPSMNSMSSGSMGSSMGMAAQQQQQQQRPQQPQKSGLDKYESLL